MAEYKKGHIISFYSNCSYNRNTNSPGHNGFGWIEYKRSSDGGETWSDAVALCDKKGRVYDALVRDDIIYVLMNDGSWKISNPEEGYYLYKSEDGGKTFSLVSRVPSAIGDAYGDIEIMDDGSMICYLYNQKDEYNLYYHISYDMGSTWEKSGKGYVAKRIRNPQVGKVKGGYILHGRAGCETPELPPHFVLYTSADGINWDEGIYICEYGNQSAYYSNNLVINNDDGSQKVLIQSSVPYDGGRVNVCHWFLDIK